MYLWNGFDYFKKACFLTLLMTFSSHMHAQSSEASRPGLEAAPTSSVAVGERQNAHNFPRWPERRYEKRERLPPPPPGPYMSSALALDGSAVSNSPFSRDHSPEKVPAKSDVSKSTFSPDTPWPSNSHSPHRWKPEDGYHYVQPQAKYQPYPAVPSNYQYGYRYPVMNRSAPVRQQVPGSVSQYQGVYRYNRQAEGNTVMQHGQGTNNATYPASRNP